jgi:hypothetical protein
MVVDGIGHGYVYVTTLVQAFGSTIGNHLDFRTGSSVGSRDGL